ncbi:Stf0 family sulfotransferase [Paraoerskovia marina]|uniref:Stf0 family sulfotransferase n=1 Tax=Paraoerskovia marina TaxID=545619 RepID=UPI0004923061|nr:Stf0 family sulfotransferase [Paraoerskovia marina]
MANAPDGEKKEPQYDRHAIRTSIRGLENQERAWNEHLPSIDADPFVVEYEDLVADPRAVVQRLGDYIGVDLTGLPPTTNTRRQATARNAEWQARYVAGE